MPQVNSEIGGLGLATPASGGSLRPHSDSSAAGPATRPGVAEGLSSGQWVTCLAEVTTSFSRWLEDRDEDETGGSIWPAFDRFVRETLLDLVGATRVRLFRVVDVGRRIRPLGEEPGASSETFVPTALMDHVLTTGRRYVRGDRSHGPLVDQLARDSEAARTEPGAAGVADGEAERILGLGPVTWMFSIRSRANPGERRGRGRSSGAAGLVVVGDLVDASPAVREGLDALASLINAFWLHVRDFEGLQRARRTDRGSGVLTRADFLELAEAVTLEARREGEPIVAMAVTLEGLRRLDDDGHWAIRDRLIREAGHVLRRKLRSDDFVGRFSDDRFVVLLRWLDLSLGRLIGAKVIQSIREAVGGILAESFGEAQKDSVKVRCGLAPSHGMDAPLKELLVGALSASASARRSGQELCIADAAAGVAAHEPAGSGKLT